MFIIKRQRLSTKKNSLHPLYHVLGIMGMLCAPVRDDKIQELKSQTQIVEIFKGKYRNVEIDAYYAVCIYGRWNKINPNHCHKYSRCTLKFK